MDPLLAAGLLLIIGFSILSTGCSSDEVTIVEVRRSDGATRVFQSWEEARDRN